MMMVDHRRWFYILWFMAASTTTNGTEEDGQANPFDFGRQERQSILVKKPTDSKRTEAAVVLIPPTCRLCNTQRDSGLFQDFSHPCACEQPVHDVCLNALRERDPDSYFMCHDCESPYQLKPNETLFGPQPVLWVSRKRRCSWLCAWLHPALATSWAMRACVHACFVALAWLLYHLEPTGSLRTRLAWQGLELDDLELAYLLSITIIGMLWVVFIFFYSLPHSRRCDTLTRCILLPFLLLVLPSMAALAWLVSTGAAIQVLAMAVAAAMDRLRLSSRLRRRMSMWEVVSQQAVKGGT
jgi:hypothetical protein